MSRGEPALLLSVFPGIDLLGRAFEEEWPEACIVRGPDVLWGGDIRKFHPPAGAFHGVFGGPPCQCFSALANLVRANGYEPKFGNLIPEFERVCAEAAPDWFLMEEVPRAPLPVVKGYAVHRFKWNNAWVPGEDALGQEQRREREFSFGVKGTEPVDLRRWMRQAAFELPKAARCVVGDKRDTPVKLGGSGKVKRQLATVSRRKGVPAKSLRGCLKASHSRGAVTSSDGGGSVRMERYTLQDALRLQGLPEDLLDEAPWTAAGKLKAVANGVPLYLGRELARAVRAAGKGEG